MDPAVRNLNVGQVANVNDPAVGFHQALMNMNFQAPLPQAVNDNNEHEAMDLQDDQVMPPAPQADAQNNQEPDMNLEDIMQD
jgi:hypothetical protein